VICTRCKGTGCVDIEHVLFTKRRAARHIRWVFRAVNGVRHNLDELRSSPKSAPHGGVSYASWLKGDDPLPVTVLYCPFQWTDGDIQDHRHPARRLWEEQCDIRCHSTYDEICPGRTDPRRLSICWRRYYELMKGA
jgi:hypothetical protein